MINTAKIINNIFPSSQSSKAEVIVFAYRRKSSSLCWDIYDLDWFIYPEVNVLVWICVLQINRFLSYTEDFLE